MFTKKTNLLALAMLLIVALAAITASFWLPFSPAAISPEQRLTGPSGAHWFGTDDFGRDIFSRTIVAALL